jgi:protein-disulfide isomerase
LAAVSRSRKNQKSELFMTKITLVAFLLAACFEAFAQSAAPRKQPAASAPSATSGSESRPTLLPSQAEVEASLQRTFGYDRGLTWQILDIRASEFPDLADLLVSINKQQPVHIYWSQRMQAAVVGNLLPFGPDPFAPARAKLQAANGPSRGAQQPAIQIVDFSDLQCPHCKAAQPIVEKVVADFPQVRLVFQQFPLPASLHPWAMKAAQYADCAGRMDKDAFWKYVNTIFENQGGIALATADDQLQGFATAVGLDGQKVASCAATSETEARLKKSLDLGESLDVNETPTVFINGRRVPGIANIPYDQLKVLVQFELDHAGK